MAVRREYIAQQYRDLLGREGADHEITGWENADSEATVRNMFLGSPEYTQRHGGTATWQDVGGVVTPTRRDSTDTGGGYQTQGGSAPPPPVATAPPAPPPVVSQPASGQRDQWSGTGDIPVSDQFGSVTGYDLTNWNDPQMQTQKYQVGRIGSRYSPADPNALNLLMADADFRRLFPNARVTDARSGSVDFGDGQGPIDLIQNFGASNARWAWQPQGAGGGSGSGGAAGSGAGTGTGSTLQDIRDTYQNLGQQYAGPGGPGITNGPLQQVGQDPLSQLISGGLVDFLSRGGSTEFGQDLQERILQMIGGDDTGVDDGQVARRFESARELLDKGRRTMINDLEGDLVSRNLLSEPGIPQGIHAGGVNRVTEQIAPEFSRALRDIYTDEASRADARQMTALQLATGMATDQARNFLAGIGEGTARQSALADIALRSLQTNMAWSQFLATYGLQRDQMLQMLQSGRIQDVMGLLNSFLSTVSLSRGGYIGN